MPNRPPKSDKPTEEVELTTEQKIDTFKASIVGLQQMNQSLLHQMMTFIVTEQPNAEELEKPAAVFAQYADQHLRSAGHFEEDLLTICKEAAALGSDPVPGLSVVEPETKESEDE